MTFKYNLQTFEVTDTDDTGKWLLNLDTGSIYYLFDGDTEPVYIPF